MQRCGVRVKGILGQWNRSCTVVCETVLTSTPNDFRMLRKFEIQMKSVNRVSNLPSMFYAVIRYTS